jgi:hypothetical protein
MHRIGECDAITDRRPFFIGQAFERIRNKRNGARVSLERSMEIS